MGFKFRNSFAIPQDEALKYWERLGRKAILKDLMSELWLAL